MNRGLILRRFGAGLLSHQRWMDTIYLMTVGVLLAWSVTSSIVTNTELSQAHLLMLVRVFVVMAVLRIVLANAYTVGLALFSAMISLAWLAWVISFGQDAEANGVLMFLVGLMNYVSGSSPGTYAYESALLWILASITSLFVAVSIFVRFNFFMLLAVSCFVVGLSLGHGLQTYHLAFYAFVFATLVNLVKHLNSKTPKAARAAFGMYAVPLVVVCLAVALALPKPAPGFAASFATDFITNPVDNINHAMFMAFRPRVFALAQTGFGMGNDRRLGGDVHTNDEVIMHIRPLQEAHGSIYLAGNILDVYTGYSWQNSFQNEDWADFGPINIALHERATSPLTALLLTEGNLQGSAFMLIDYWQGNEASPHALMDFSPGSLVVNLDALSRSYIDVHIGPFRTFTAFHTGIIAELSGINHDIDFLQNRNGTILTRELMPRDATYRMGFYNLPLVSDNLALINHNHLRGMQSPDGHAFLRFSRRGVLREALYELERLESEYDDFVSYSVIVSQNGRGIAFSEVLEYLIAHADWVYETYTILPEAFPERVTELAGRITQGATSDYERAVIVRDFLLQFPYTLTPGSIPAGRDFVDYFLFDVFEGYCTYFASAFVTMMRALGIPARYVEGFNVQINPDENGFIPVLNNQGHAWGEVYFEGFGWQKFEATPGGGGVPQALAHNYDSEPFVETFAGGVYDDFLTEGFWHDMNEAATETPTENQPHIVQLDDASNQASVWSALWLIPIFLIVARVWWVRQKASTPKTNNEAVITSYKKMMRHLSLLGVELYKYDTPSSVAKRLSYTQLGIDMHIVASIFSKARYSPQSIADDELSVVEKTLDEVEAKLQKTMGRVRYTAYKYIFS